MANGKWKIAQAHCQVGVRKRFKRIKFYLVEKLLLC